MYSMRVKKNFDLARRLKVIYRGDYRGFLRPAGGVIINNNISNIKHQITPSGSQLKKNAPSTLKIKRMLGKGQLSLVWDRLLIDKATWLSKADKKRLKIRLAKVRSKIGRYVEAMGYEFFGISLTARKIILARWHDYIMRGLK